MNRIKVLPGDLPEHVSTQQFSTFSLLDYMKGAVLQNLRRRVQEHHAYMIDSVLGTQRLAGLPSLAQEMLHRERHDC